MAETALQELGVLPQITPRMRHSDIPGGVGPASCKRDDVVEVQIFGVDGLLANMADAFVAFEDGDVRNTANRRTALAQRAACGAFGLECLRPFWVVAKIAGFRRHLPFRMGGPVFAFIRALLFRIGAAAFQGFGLESFLVLAAKARTIGAKRGAACLAIRCRFPDFAACQYRYFVAFVGFSIQRLHLLASSSFVFALVSASCFGVFVRHGASPLGGIIP